MAKTVTQVKQPGTLLQITIFTRTVRPLSTYISKTYLTMLAFGGYYAYNIICAVSDTMKITRREEMTQNCRRERTQRKRTKDIFEQLKVLSTSMINRFNSSRKTRKIQTFKGQLETSGNDRSDAARDQGHFNHEYIQLFKFPLLVTRAGCNEITILQVTKRFQPGCHHAWSEHALRMDADVFCSPQWQAQIPRYISNAQLESKEGKNQYWKGKVIKSWQKPEYAHLDTEMDIFWSVKLKDLQICRLCFPVTWSNKGGAVYFDKLWWWILHWLSSYVKLSYW